MSAWFAPFRFSGVHPKVETMSMFLLHFAPYETFNAVCCLNVIHTQLLFVHSIIRCLLEDCTSKAKYDNGVMTIKNLDAGYYTFRVGEHLEIDITIYPAPTKAIIEGLEEFNIDSEWIVQIPDSAKHPLYVQPPVANEETQTVEIQVRNWTPDTRVVVVATKFLPPKMAFENLSVKEFEKPSVKSKVELTSTTYRTGRILGDEYQYILNRKAQSTHWAGNLLTKPSALLAPYVSFSIMSFFLLSTSFPLHVSVLIRYHLFVFHISRVLRTRR